MLSISQPIHGVGKANYYIELAREDYYLEGGEPPGRWYGKAKLAFGVEGEVDKEVLRNVLLGCSANGKVPLVQNAKDPKRVSAWDLTFSAPKSVSVAWSQSSEELRGEIQKAHNQAVQTALDYLQDVAGLSRMDKGGSRLEKAEVLFALFDHGTSRAMDPQLHTHALLLNTCFRPDGTSGTVWSHNFFRHKMTAGAFYQAQLGYELKRLGFVLEKDRYGFAITGISKNLCDWFSKRRQEIERHLNEKGESGAKASERAAFETRDHKAHRPRSELFPEWQRVGKSYGCDREHVEKIRTDPAWAFQFREGKSNRRTESENRSNGESENRSKKNSESGSTEESKSQNTWEAKNEKPPDGEAHQAKPRKPPKSHRPADENRAKAILEKHEKQRLKKGKDGFSARQKEAIHKITTEAGGIKVVSGFDDTQKSEVLRVARDIWKREKLTVLGASFSDSSRKGVEQGAKIPSVSAAELIRELGKSYAGIEVRHFRIAPDAPRWSWLFEKEIPYLAFRIRGAEFSIGKTTVVVLDETHDATPTQVRLLAEYCRKLGAKFVAIGAAPRLHAHDVEAEYRAQSTTTEKAARNSEDRGTETTQRETGAHEEVFGDKREDQETSAESKKPESSSETKAHEAHGQKVHQESGHTEKTHETSTHTEEPHAEERHETHHHEEKHTSSHTTKDHESVTQEDQHAAKEIVKIAMEEVSKRHSYFPERQILREALETAAPHGIDSKYIREALTKHVGNSELIFVGEHKGEKLYTTKDTLDRENAIFDIADRSKENACQKIRAEVVEKSLDQQEKQALRENRHTLSEEQKDAVRHIASEQGSIKLVSGMAGSGKTSMLSAAKDVWEKEGFTVLGVAPTGKASRELEKGTQIPSFTLHKLLHELEKPNAFFQVNEQPIAPNAPRWSPFKGATVPYLSININKQEFKLGKDTVLILDEAGMVGTKQLHSLMQHCERAGTKLVAVGQASQIQAVEAGGGFKALEERLGASKLNDIKRQQNPVEREIVRDFERGDAAKAIDKAVELGNVHVGKNQALTMSKLISDWKKDGASNPKDHVIIAGTNETVDTLNRLAQDERERQGYLGKESLRVNSERVRVGDRILFSENSTKLGVDNGMLGTVARIKGHTLDFQLDDGRTTSISTFEYDKFGLGYAITTHKSQAGTFKETYAMVESQMQDLHLTYVQASRAKERTRYYMDKQTAGKNFEEIIDKMKQSKAKEFATQKMESLGQVQPKTTQHTQDFGKQPS